MSGRQPILDEFTALPVSRQRKWQLRRRKEGRCLICGTAARLSGERCAPCRTTHALMQLKHRGEPATPRRGKWLTLAGKRG
jgi:hypothetical protein